MLGRTRPGASSWSDEECEVPDLQLARCRPQHSLACHSQQQQIWYKARAGACAAPAPTSLPDHGAPTLRALCLHALGECLEELLELRDELGLQHLPAELKACLLAVARLRSLLSDEALLLLTDAHQSVLDLRSAGVSEAGICEALCQMPELQHVDLRGCSVGAVTLRTLGKACPRVSVLRLGGEHTDHAPGMAAALKSILPGLDKHRMSVADSWEVAAAAMEDAGCAPLACPGRLMQLRCLVWPRMPFSMQQHCASACPHVAVNPTPEDVGQREWPQEFIQDTPLDAPLLAGVAYVDHWAQDEAAQAHGGRGVVREETELLPIAERFRLAYISRAKRLRAVRDKLERQQWRRAMRRSPAEQLIYNWESEV